eukprot:606558-Prymnesium_polylepis.1
MRQSCRISERAQSSLLPSRTQCSSRSSGVSWSSTSSDEALLDREEMLDRVDRVPRSISPKRVVNCCPPPRKARRRSQVRSWMGTAREECRPDAL